MTVYGGGLRLNEACHLRVEDLQSRAYPCLKLPTSDKRLRCDLKTLHQTFRTS
jgi:hypothetical protein